LETTLNFTNFEFQFLPKPHFSHCMRRALRLLWGPRGPAARTGCRGVGDDREFVARETGTLAIFCINYHAWETALGSHCRQTLELVIGTM
jgi:hypothetical protein